MNKSTFKRQVEFINSETCMKSDAKLTTKDKKFLPDDIDKKMISLLLQNGRVSNVELAKQVGLSPPPCLRRLKVLEKEKIIKKYTAQVDYKRLGYEVKAMLVVTLAPSTASVINEFVQIINGLSNVIDVQVTIDNLNFIVFFVAKNLDDYSYFLKTYIQNSKNIKSFKSHIIRDNFTG